MKVGSRQPDPVERRLQFSLTLSRNAREPSPGRKWGGKGNTSVQRLLMEPKSILTPECEDNMHNDWNGIRYTVCSPSHVQHSNACMVWQYHALRMLHLVPSVPPPPFLSFSKVLLLFRITGITSTCSLGILALFFHENSAQPLLVFIPVPRHTQLSAYFFPLHLSIPSLLINYSTFAPSTHMYLWGGFRWWGLICKSIEEVLERFSWPFGIKDHFLLIQSSSGKEVSWTKHKQWNGWID